jgi:hypothetical protein
MARFLDTNLYSFDDGFGLINNTGQFSTSTNLFEYVDMIGGNSEPIGVTITAPISYNEYIIRVSSNETNATILVNGVNTQKTTPENIIITKTQLLSGDVELRIIKEGFVTLERYIVSLAPPPNSVIINNTNFNQPLGLSVADVSVRYYIGDVEQSTPVTLQNGNFIYADFTLNRVRVSPISSELLKFNVFVAGTTNSVLINKNGQVDLYPKLGGTNYEDAEGTVFSIKSSDTKLYRVTEIIVEGEGEASQILTAGTDESLNVNLTLNKSYTIRVQTQELLQALPALDPRISLLNFDARTYNINSKAGVPIIVRKNFDVKAITVIVGENVYEYDSLDEGDITGITIPHAAFRGIGQYSIKIYPFSLKDYESQVRPETPPIVVTQNIQNIKSPVVSVSEVVEVPSIKLFMSPYELPILNVIPTTSIIPITPTVISPEPIITYGGGGGGTYYSPIEYGIGFSRDQVFDRTTSEMQNIQ